MLKRTLQTGLLAAITACLLVGCNQETRYGQEVGRAAPVSQPAATASERFSTGERLFSQYCSPCHPDGGNVSDPRKSLRSSDLKANHITRPQDIVRIMRNPGSRMMRFDVTTISDADATAIAEYVMTSFRN